jgi:O-acetyl-ADP-ribose deacetylase (regulator of RNase III)
MKTLRYIDGNLLLNKEIEVLAHSCNCQNTFGSGIARSILEMYPEAYAADTLANQIRLAGGGVGNVLGNYSVSYIEPATRQKHGTKINHIFNLYGQNLGTDKSKLYDRKTNYEALYCALEKMAYTLIHGEAFSAHRYQTVGFPYKMGSDRGGGSWDIVERMIAVAFNGYLGDVLIVKLEPSKP